MAPVAKSWARETWLTPSDDPTAGCAARSAYQQLIAAMGDGVLADHRSGAEMQVRKFEVRSRVAGTSDGDRHGDQPT